MKQSISSSLSLSANLSAKSLNAVTSAETGRWQRTLRKVVESEEGATLGLTKWTEFLATGWT